MKWWALGGFLLATWPGKGPFHVHVQSHAFTDILHGTQFHVVYLTMQGVSLLSFSQVVGMGKRKLRFDQRKNYERKKYGFRVMMQLALLTPHELVVHLPLSAYFGADARDASVLLSRLQRSEKIPNSWVISHSIPACSHRFMLCKLQQRPNVSTPTIMFSIAFDSQCMWMLCVESRVLVAGSCGLLSGVETTLRSVDAVARLVSLLDRASSVWEIVRANSLTLQIVIEELSRTVLVRMYHVHQVPLSVTVFSLLSIRKHSHCLP